MPLSYPELSTDKLNDNLHNRNDDLLKILLQLKGYSLVMLNSTGHVITWNAGAYQLYGYKAEEIIGKYISVFYTAEDIQSGLPEANLKLALDKGKHEFEILKRRKDGSEFHSNTILTVLYNTNGTLEGFVKITRDISKEKKLENKNILLTERLEEKVRRRTKKLLTANKKLAFQNEEKEKRANELAIANKELAFQSEEKQKRASELIIANKHLAFQNQEKENRANELVIANKELAFQNEEKQKRAVELTIANENLSIQYAEKEKKGEELSAANTELMLVENQLKVVNKELEAFSYSVSHDLRAPLRAISGFSAMLKEDYKIKIDAEGNRIIDVIIAKTKMMGQLIDDLLKFSKMARAEVVSDSIDMKKLAETCIEDLLQNEKKTEIYFNISPMPYCSGDTSMLKQVWFNLISNALKYSSKKSLQRIEAGAVNNDKCTIYYVKDNGTGFDMKFYQKLFGVFQRLHRKDEFEGTGVGLALAKRIISKHGGEIWAESILNEGATFYFSIPKASDNGK